MAECGSFSRNLSRDFQVIYAKYSQSFDGCPEFCLSEFDHSDHIKEVECVRLSLCEQLSVLQPNNDSSSPDSCLPTSSFSSDDENCGLITYHKDEETSQIFTTPLGSLVSGEDSTSSSSNESGDDKVGWESDCSGPTEDYPSTTSETQVEIYPSPLKAVSPNPNPNNHGSYNSTCVYDKAFLSGYNNEPTCAHTKEHGNKWRQSKGNMAVQDKSSDFCNVDVGSCQNKAMRSTLLSAVNEFRNIVANFLAVSQGNHRLSQRHTFPNLGSSEKCDDREKCLAKSSQSFHRDNEFVGDKKRENGQNYSKSRKSLDFQPAAFVVEKIFARPRGLSGESFVEVASRKSLNTPAASFTSLNKSLRNSRLDNHRVNRIPLSSTEASDEGVSSGVSSPGVNSPGGKSPGVRWLCAPLRDIHGNELVSYGEDSTPCVKRSGTRRHSIRLRGSPFGNNENKSDGMMSPSLVESPKVIRDSVAWKQTFWVDADKCNTDHVKPLPTTEMANENRVISPGNKNLRPTRRSPSFQGCFPSDEMNQPKSSFTRSPLSALCQDKGDASPGFESRATGRRSVPLRATPGSSNMRLSDATLGLSHRTSTPVKRTPDPETFFGQKRSIPCRLLTKPESPTPRHSSPRHSSPRHSTTEHCTPELPPTGPTTEYSTTGHSIPGYTIPSITGHSTHARSTTVHSTHGHSTPSPIRQLTSSKGDELDNGLTLDGHRSRVRGLLERSNRNRLYSLGGHLPRVGETSEVQSAVPLQVDETGTSGQASLKTPQCFRLLRKRFEDTSNSRSVFSSDGNPRGKSLKMKNTPRSNSPGFHPYIKYSPARTKQTSALESPLQRLRTLSSASSCDETVRRPSIRHPSGNSPSKYGHTHEQTRPSNKNLQSDAFKKKHALDQTEDSDAVQSTIRHSSGKYGHAPEERQPSKKNPQSGVFKKKYEDSSEDNVQVNENCSKGNCTKRFCFDCSMDCS